MLNSCRAFGSGRRRGHFDLLRDRAWGFTPARDRQVQLKLGWRSLCGHETSELLALSFNPSSGTVRAFGRHADLLCPLLTSASRSGRLAASSVPQVPRGDTMQISWGKPRSLPRTPVGFTALALDGYGLCDFLPARPTSSASYPISVRRVAISLHASFRRSLAVPPLRFARASPPSGCTGDLHPQAAGHAQHTGRPAGAAARCCASLTATPRGAPKSCRPGRRNGPQPNRETRQDPKSAVDNFCSGKDLSFEEDSRH